MDSNELGRNQPLKWCVVLLWMVLSMFPQSSKKFPFSLDGMSAVALDYEGLFFGGCALRLQHISDGGQVEVLSGRLVCQFANNRALDQACFESDSYFMVHAVNSMQPSLDVLSQLGPINEDVRYFLDFPWVIHSTH